MSILKYSALVFAVLISGLRFAFGGQAVVVPVKEFYDNAELVVEGDYRCFGVTDKYLRYLRYL